MVFYKIGLSLGVFTIFISILAAIFPSTVEQIYSSNIYPAIRLVIDNTIGKIPSALTYLFLIFIFASVLFFVYKLGFYSLRKDISSLKNLGLSTLAALSTAAFVFYFFWGYNYKRTPLSKSLYCNVEILKPLELEKELDSAISDLEKSLIGINAYDSVKTEPTVEDVRSSVANFLTKNHFVVKGKPRIDFIEPKGALYYFGIAGIYNPFLGRACVESGQHEIEKYFTIAHELSHAYGFTNEGDCNFLAYAALSEADNPNLVYSARLNYFRYVGSAYKRTFPAKYVEKRKKLSPIIISDLDAINEIHKKYPTLMNTEFLNDKYLKMQGVKEGISSYGAIVNWGAAWRKKNFANFTQNSY